MNDNMIYWCFISFFALFFTGWIVMWVLAERKVRLHNTKFSLSFQTRVVRKNTGDGSKYFPQFYDGNWYDFLEFDSWCGSYTVDTVYYSTPEKCLIFINDIKAKFRPEIEVINI